MADDRTIAISSTNHLGPDEVIRRTFATVRRGFDPNEVRSFLEEVARELSASLEREQGLKADVADADHRAANPVLDDETLTTALGQETARVLRAAHDAANDLMKRAEEESSELVEKAERRESQSRADAEREAAEQATALQAERTQAHRQSELEAASRLEAARLESEEMLERTRAECRSMVQQAQELRTKVLTDLSTRRRVLHLQIEQLRAGRERLSETIQEARLSVDHIADDLLRAEDEARLAAEVAGRNAAERPDPDLDDAISSGSEVSTTDMARSEPEAPAGGRGRKVTTEQASVAETTSGLQDLPAADLGDGPQLSDDSESTGEVIDQQVEDLFARLRASGMSESSLPGATGETPTEGSEESRLLEPSSMSNGAGASVAKESSEQGREPTITIERSVELVRKDELLGPVIAGLTRRVRRALQDDQNGILDRLRNLGGWKDGVLPDIDEHTARYVEASSEMLAEASRAGVTFVGVSIERALGVEEEASKFAAEIVVPLRRRLEEDGPSLDPTDEAALVEHVGAAFREWRGDRTERLAGDHATAAFSKSALAETVGDVNIRWIVDDEGSPCADCEDNALAEDVKPGQPFPTGHTYPPAHSGCRCLLVVPTAT